jgi:hypothetical protein
MMVDTHEHLIPEIERLNAQVDVLATFFPHYASSDLKAAGMPEEELLHIRKASAPLKERWALFEPWWEKIRNTGYARAMEIAARDLYGRCEGPLRSRWDQRRQLRGSLGQDQGPEPRGPL